MRQNITISPNKNPYRLLYVIKLAVTIGCVSEIVYLSLYYYGNCQYEQSLGCLQKAQGRLNRPKVVYLRYIYSSLEMLDQKDVSP